MKRTVRPAVGTMGVVVTEPAGLPGETIEQLRRLGPVTLGPFDRPGLLRAVESASVLMVRLSHQINKEVLEAASKLEAIASATTGLNHIDIETCGERGIEVICIRGERAFLATITSTAELALAHLLNLARNVVPAHANVTSGGWNRDKYRGVSLRGLTLGIVGLGRLGSVMAGYGHALGMRVVGTDCVPVEAPPFVVVTDLDTVLVSSDCISLHATHDPGGPPLLSENEFGRMKRGALLVNTARGELIDEAALLASLERGHLGGYAADVIANETDWTDSSAHLVTQPLVKYAQAHDNVIITPHVGGAPLNGLQRAEAFVVAKVLKHFHVAATNGAQDSTRIPNG